VSKHPHINLLIVGWSQSDFNKIVQTLREAGYTVQEMSAEREQEVHNYIEYKPIDLIIVHPGEGLPTVAQVHERVISVSQDIPVIVALDDKARQRTVEFLRAGADNFFELGDPEHLVLVVRKELRHLGLRKQVRSQETRLKEEEARSQALLERSRDAIAYIHEGAHIYANPSYLDLFGYAGENKIQGIPLMELIIPEDRDKLKRLLRHATKTGKPLDPVELTGVGNNKQRFPMHMACIPTRMNDEPCLQILIQNPFQQQDFAKKLNEIVQHDVLTGLYNRKFFTQFLDKICSEETSPRGSVFYILLTDYRAVSEQLGLEVVDQMLANLAKLLGHLVSEKEIVAHFSDAVFTLYTPESSSKNVLQLGELICNAISNHDTHVAEKLVNTSCSIGICLLQQNHKNAAQVIFHADRACETARQMGGNQVQIYDPPGTETGLAREEEQDLLDQIKNAVVKERLLLFYQPIASFQGEAKERYKAYLRIVDETQQPLSLDVLAPVAEQHNLMGQLDKWVIVRCLETLAEQRQGDKAVPTLFIRISDNSLTDLNFHQWLQQRLKETDLPGGILAIEIPEDSAEKYFKEVKVLRQRLRDMGCGFALSHFGSKANSERILHYLVPDYIKLDISFIENLTKSRDEASRRAMNTLTEKAQEIKTRVIASNVANASQMASMWQFGVTLVQGDMVHEARPQMDFDFQQFSG
jgi:diguanylate cyclase (GGDEF)-like protein/PAS domain S-box-containing protein